MKVLKAIGRFFARIGRWIRDTAWIQPLLIVGGIFAVIFSIPYLTNWVKSWFDEGDAATAYYRGKELSWDGIIDGDSEIDRLFSYLENPTDSKYANEAKKYGNKFFINFVQEGCDGCQENYSGFKTLENNWGKGEFTFEDGKKEDLKIFNIFIDEGDDEHAQYFMDYISGDKSTCRYIDFFNAASTLKNNYCVNKGGADADTYFERLASNDNSFESPITILIDMEWDDANYECEFGITEIFYQISGKNSQNGGWGKARSIWDCWNHAGDFSANPDK